MFRNLRHVVAQDLKEKMVFLAGPRQVGKTTLARDLKLFRQQLYLNWDRKDDRRAILREEWPAEESLVILDELHKYARWKNWLKGQFDHFHERIHFLVTGSARLDVYRRGGDSMLGRYHLHRLHPFSVAELVSKGQASSFATPGEELNIPSDSKHLAAADALKSLLAFGGFPEPFLRQNARFLRRWQLERMDRFFSEDVRSLERVSDLATMEVMASLLVERASASLSLNAMREDLELSFKAVKHWIEILERLYYCYRIYPFAGKKIHSLKKEPKLYLWDWSMIADEGRRFENMVGSHLLKFCHALNDCEGHRADLHYLRDVDRREVDFLVTLNRKPWFMVEAKLSDEAASPALRYFGDRLAIPHRYQVVAHGHRDFIASGTRVIPAAKFLSALV